MHVQRRSLERRTLKEGERRTQLRMRVGPELRVLNISNAGALVEADVRLAPGARLEVHVITARGRTLARCRVVRAFVCHVRTNTIRYRVALSFDQAIDCPELDDQQQPARPLLSTGADLTPRHLRE